MGKAVTASDRDPEATGQTGCAISIGFADREITSAKWTSPEFMAN
jgi:hypothetical protein